jgi:hypothetical protein
LFFLEEMTKKSLVVDFLICDWLAEQSAGINVPDCRLAQRRDSTQSGGEESVRRRTTCEIFFVFFKIKTPIRCDIFYFYFSISFENYFCCWVQAVNSFQTA